MKRSIFTVLAVMSLLLAVPAVAQEALAQEEDSRTNPDARSIAPGSGLTITGTVVEFNDEQLVIRSATGVQHIQILPDTQKPVDLQPGVGVSVDYNRTSQGVMIAQTIRTAGVAGEATADTTASSLTVDTDADLDTDVAVETDADLRADLDTESDLDADFDADLDTDVTTADSSFDEDLPATGSRLPLLGLLGLLTVAAALGVRSLLR